MRTSYKGTLRERWIIDFSSEYSLTNSRSFYYDKTFRFSTEGYKAFGTLTPIIRLAPITIVLGRNNSGKSALCRAPLFFSYLFRYDAETPFYLEAGDIDFGMNFSDVCFNQRIDGLKATLFFEDSDIEYVKIGGAAIQEKALSSDYNRP
ncbi:MAG: hypothetical protein HC887_08390 [Desulfobacteraceae bacterium]|nr:hypothetical protein [Desulfobacteraceae bacterium]